MSKHPKEMLQVDDRVVYTVDRRAHRGPGVRWELWDTWVARPNVPGERELFGSSVDHFFPTEEYLESVVIQYLRWFTIHCRQLGYSCAHVTNKDDDCIFCDNHSDEVIRAFDNEWPELSGIGKHYLCVYNGDPTNPWYELRGYEYARDDVRAWRAAMDEPIDPSAHPADNVRVNWRGNLYTIDDKIYWELSPGSWKLSSGSWVASCLLATWDDPVYSTMSYELTDNDLAEAANIVERMFVSKHVKSI